jgi:hypothetical protein
MSFLFWFIAFCLNIFSVNPQVLKDSTKYHSHDSRQLDSQNISHAHRHIVNKDLFEALGFLNNVLQPDNCVGLDYAVVRIGNGGGFASQFQLVGGEWMRAFAYLNYSKPVLIQGNIRGYSDGKQCDHVNHDWTCFFFELSSCQKELLKTGKNQQISKSSYVIFFQRQTVRNTINVLQLQSTRSSYFCTFGTGFLVGCRSIQNVQNFTFCGEIHHG